MKEANETHPNCFNSPRQQPSELYSWLTMRVKGKRPKFPNNKAKVL